MPIKAKGNTKGLKPLQKKLVDKLFERKLNPKSAISPEFAKALAFISADIKRQIGILIDRKGHVVDVFIGTAKGVVISDFGRYRAGASRLRGLRLIHTRLFENSLNTDERRVRSYGIDNNYTYYYTVKKQYNEGRIEIEERISEKEFLRFLPDMKSKLSKKRYCIAYDSQYIKLDIFDFEQDLAIVEVELSDITNEVNLPEAFEVIKEVTNDENYLNKNIALRKMLEYY